MVEFFFLIYHSHIIVICFFFYLEHTWNIITFSILIIYIINVKKYIIFTLIICGINIKNIIFILVIRLTNIKYYHRRFGCN